MTFGGDFLWLFDKFVFFSDPNYQRKIIIDRMISNNGNRLMKKGLI